MNQEGCPPGWFTDDILAFYTVPGSCDSSVLAWVVSMTFVVAMRIGILSVTWYIWFQRRQRLKDAATLVTKEVKQPVIGAKASRASARVAQNVLSSRRFPLIPVLATFDTLLQVLFYILSTTNTISVSNGQVIPVIAFWVVSICLIQFFALKKVIGLGARLFKFGDQRYANARMSSLSSLDLFLKIVFILMVSLVVSSGILGITAGLTSDAATRAVYTRIGLVFFLLQSVLFHLSLIHQYRRVINCVVEAHNQVKYESFKRALDTLRYNQAVIGVSALPIIAEYMYFILTLQYYYWMVAVTFGVEGAVYGVLARREMQYARMTERDTRHTTLSSSLVGSPQSPGEVKKTIGGGMRAIAEGDDGVAERDEANVTIAVAVNPDLNAAAATHVLPVLDAENQT